MSSGKPKVVIVGGGFGGLNCALALRKAEVSITLVDRRNFHLFQPLLYQVATGGLSQANIAAPLRGVLRRQRHQTRVVLGNVNDIDLSRKEVHLADGVEPYDYLVVRPGTARLLRAQRWGRARAKDGGRRHRIRRRSCGGRVAERATDPAVQHAWLTFVFGRRRRR